MAYEILSDTKIHGNLDVTGACTLGTALAVAEGGTGATTAQAARNNLLPTQSGATGYYLTTNGTDASWGQVGYSSLSSAPSAGVVGGRLSLSSTNPVNGGDVTNAQYVYFHPFNGNTVPVYNGTSLVHYPITYAGNDYLYQDVTAGSGVTNPVAANSIYDLFVILNGSTPQLVRSLAWNTSTARATGHSLVWRKGILVNNAAFQTYSNIGIENVSAERGTYVGTIRTNASSRVDDTTVYRFLWNYYNRVPLNLAAADSSAHSPGNLGGFRAWNGGNATQVHWVTGVSEDRMSFSVWGEWNGQYLAIGVDSAGETFSALLNGANGASYYRLSGHYTGWVGQGYHYAQVTEATFLTGCTFNAARINVLLRG